MKREMTCIICPMGCQMTVTQNADGDNIVVDGNTCPRGRSYAIAECTHPTRTLTTTAPTSDGRVIPVKTAQAIPKELLFPAMEEINRATVTLPARIGDTVIRDLLGTAVDVIVTANMD